MKKIFTVLMALGIALCTVANPTFSVAEKLDMSKVKTPKMEKQFTPVEKTSKVVRVDKQDARQAMVEARQAKAVAPMAINGVRQVEAMPVAEKQAIPANAVRKAPAKAAAEIVAKDTVKFVAAAWNYQYYEDTQDWWMAVIDETGTYRLDFDYVVPVENFAGTYTIEDLDLNYSYLTTIDEEGYKHYVDYVSAEFTVTDNAEGKSLVANVLCEDSVRYLVTAVELPLPEAKDTVELAYTNGHLEDGTRSSETFQFWADENGVYTSLLIASDQVEGEYTEKDMYVDYANYILFVDGTDSTFVDFLALNLTVTKEDQTYFADAYALGVDTVMYHITMSYTKPAPTDTIDIVATNMTIDEFELFGMYFCTITASNEEYTVTLDMANGLPLGELTSADFNVEWSSVYRIADSTEIVFDDILSATVTEVDGQRAIKAQALGVDTILYNLDLSYVLPEAKDTVAIEFTTPASSEYYDSYGDYYIYNKNEEYIVILDIFAEKNALEGEYEGEDFDYYYTKVGLIVDGDTTAVEVALAKANVTKVSEELAHIDAELLCENEVLYLVSTDVTMSKLGLQYDMTEGEVNREYNLNDELTITTDYVADYGELYVDVMAGDMSDLMSLLFFVNDTVEGLVIPEGTYPISDTYAEGTVLASTGYDADYGAMPSNYCTLVADGGNLYLNECFFMVGGSVVVEHVDGHLKITIDAVNSYDVPAHIVYEATPEPVVVTEMVGVVKRAVQNGDAVIVLTHEENGAAHIYEVVNGVAVAEISQEGVIAVDAENPGSYLAISDIAVTEDGKLVANNYNRCSFNDGVVESGYKRGTLTFYIWEDLAAAPAIWFQSKASSNSNNSDQGYTMAVTGTSTNANILVSGVHNTQRGVRMSHFSIVDGVFEDTQDGSANLPYYYYVGSNFKGASAGADAAVFNEQTHGANIQFHASPLTPENWIIDGELTNPIEFINPQTHGGEVVINATLSEDLGKKYNGASYVTVGEKVLMVAPFANPDGELVGAEILNITNGFDAPQYVDMVYVDEAVAATAAATAVEVVEGGLNITLVADAAIHTWFVEMSEGTEYEVYEEEITNLVIDLDNLVLMGGPGSAFQVEVYLPLGEYNMSEDSYQLTSESSIAVLGSDATFIEGYAYEVDAFTPSAKAVVRCEWNGMLLEFHLTMTAAPLEPTVVVVENAMVEIEKYLLWGDMYDYALKMTGEWVNPEDGLTYPVLVDVPVYYPEATEPSEIMSTVTVGGDDEDDPWLGFGEGTLTVTTVDGVVTATGIVQNPMAGVAIDITISGKLPQGPGTGLDNVQVEVKTVKMIKNGQLIIIRNGKAYNAIGVQVK